MARDGAPGKGSFRGFDLTVLWRGSHWEGYAILDLPEKGGKRERVAFFAEDPSRAVVEQTLRESIDRWVLAQEGRGGSP